MRFGAEVLEGLRDLVFRNGAVVLGEVRNEFAGVVLYGEEKIDEVDVETQGADGLVVVGRRRGVAYGRSVGRRNKLSPCCRREQRQGDKKSDEIAGDSHLGKLDAERGPKESTFIVMRDASVADSAG